MRLLAFLTSSIASSAVLAALLVPTLARAAGVSPAVATPEQKKEATAHFISGRHAIEAGDLQLAVTELQLSIDVVDSPNAHLELARALRNQGHFDKAWAEYGLAAEIAGALKEDRYGKTAEAAVAERAETEKRLAFVAIIVSHAPADAVLQVGGRALSAREWSAPVAVLPGAIEVVLTDAHGTELVRSRSIVTVGAVASVTLDAQQPSSTPLAARSGSSASSAGAETAGKADPDQADDKDSDAADQEPRPLPLLPPPPAPATSGLRPLAFVSGGIGLAGLATFAVFGLLSNATYDDLKSNCPHGCPTDRHGEIDSGILQQTVANVGLGVGIVGAVGATTLFLLSAGSRSPAAAPASSPASALVIAPGYLGVRGTL